MLLLYMKKLFLWKIVYSDIWDMIKVWTELFISDVSSACRSLDRIAYLLTRCMCKMWNRSTLLHAEPSKNETFNFYNYIYGVFLNFISSVSKRTWWRNLFRSLTKWSIKVVRYYINTKNVFLRIMNPHLWSRLSDEISVF